MEAKCAISSLLEMERLAITISRQVAVGDVLLLNGPLGAGKTFLAQTLIKSLGVTEKVTSPTFVMVKSYQGKFPIHHVDAYRLLDLENPRQAFLELDIDFEQSLTIVEWGEQFDINGQGLHVDIKIGDGESRFITVRGSLSRWANLKL